MTRGKKSKRWLALVFKRQFWVKCGFFGLQINVLPIVFWAKTMGKTLKHTKHIIVIIMIINI